MSKYLLSNGLYTEDPKTYIEDYINIVFETEQYDVPTSMLGFSHSLEQVDQEGVRLTLQLRIESALKSMSSFMGYSLSLEKFSLRDDNQCEILIKTEYNEQYEVTVNV